jgi:hypothetical protein
VKAIVVAMVLLPACFVASIRIFGHTYPRFRLTHFVAYRILAPGISYEGVTICPEGCKTMEDDSRPATVNGIRIIALAHPRSIAYCSTLELVDYEYKHSEGSEVLYDSCDSVMNGK